MNITVPLTCSPVPRQPVASKPPPAIAVAGPGNPCFECGRRHREGGRQPQHVLRALRRQGVGLSRRLLRHRAGPSAPAGVLPGGGDACWLWVTAVELVCGAACARRLAAERERSEWAAGLPPDEPPILNTTMTMTAATTAAPAAIRRRRRREERDLRPLAVGACWGERGPAEPRRGGSPCLPGWVIPGRGRDRRKHVHKVTSGSGRPARERQTQNPVGRDHEVSRGRRTTSIRPSATAT